MVSQIVFSKKTKEIIARIESDVIPIEIPLEFKNSSTVTKPDLVKWLSQKQQGDKKTLFLAELLSVSILDDIYQALPRKKSRAPDNDAGWFAKLKFLLLAIAGIIYCACEGFDGITAILSLTALPSVLIFAGGVIFSGLSLVVFFAFDLVEISRNLGINIKNASKAVDVYLREIELIKLLRKSIDKSYFEENIDELENHLGLLGMLNDRYKGLDEARLALKQAHDHPKLRVAKFITALVSGILFFSAGYFAGQTVSMMLAGFIMAGAVAPAFWPVILAGAAVGLAALSVYWFVQRPGIENLISSWVGLDKDKVDKLCDDEAVQKEQGKLDLLQQKIIKRCTGLQELSQVKAQISNLTERFQNHRQLIRGPLQRTNSMDSFFQPIPVEIDPLILEPPIPALRFQR